MFFDILGRFVLFLVYLRVLHKNRYTGLIYHILAQFHFFAYLILILVVDHIVEKLTALGADIKMIEVEDK